MKFSRNIRSCRSLLFAGTFIAALACTTTAIAQTDSTNRGSGNPITALPLEKSASRGIVTRDPSDIVKCKDEYWMFYTGRGVPSYHSRDLVKWVRGPAVFKTPPEWIAAAVPNNRRMSYWAPDIMKVGDRYLLYYAVSSMGSMTSAIGLATNPTLDPSDPAYHWTDEGVVVRTKDGDNYNAIDPTVFQDTDGSLWLTFGSYWSGIKITQLDPKTGKRIALDSVIYPLAYNESIEASYLCKHDDYYYLFVNWGSCCQGPKSTYNIRIGRSQTITGPYLDKAGVNMLQRGGSVFLANTNGPLIGPGHAGTLTAEGKTWFTSDFEGDLRMNGRATLAIMPLRWNADGWPEATVNDTNTATSDPVNGAPPSDWIKWQQERRESIAGSNGWTTLISLYWLPEGTTFAGADPTNQFVLPVGSAPGCAGVFSRKAESVRFKAAAGVAATADGAVVDDLEMRSDASGKPSKLMIGPLSFVVIERGGRYGVRVRDPESPARLQFAGLQYFPYDLSWRIEGRFEAFPSRQTLRVPDASGGMQALDSPGALVFSHEGKEYRLDAVDEGPGEDYFVIFTDRTAGDSTYDAGRFLYVARPDASNRVIIDFNRAFTPPCGFTPFATCPRPPEQNRLPFAITAGERKPVEAH